MKKLVEFILGSVFWYSIFAFVMWEPNAFAWHWGVRLIYSLFVIGVLRSSLED